ncbi:epsin-2 [Poecilia reticulata]|uniref:epsin-2 n=1 Tax=Poecilia reticulata TaxID=8081 RepID=UPI0004A2CC2E|nr:PREDICTED: epsin-2 [Poecilia reticulata]
MPSTIRRQMKNMVNNYSDAEKKVREATSNDPWGPSSSLMSEVADLTYNVVAFSEIMNMIWKRLNDHGKNWRHVYKALTLLDYLIKTGSERVALQCKENIFAIQTLKDFQYIDKDGKDQGINVREKSKQLVVLLKDEERLKGERSQALKTKERMAQVSTGSTQMGFGRGSSQPNLSTSYSEEYGRSEGSPASYHGSTSPNAGSELEQARPQTSGEEELQLQLALAMSREAAEQVCTHRLRYVLRHASVPPLLCAKSRLSSLTDISSNRYISPDPWAAPATLPAIKASDPWANSAPASDPWGSGAGRPKTSNTSNFDLFSTSNGTSKEDFSEFDSLRSSSSVPTADAGITSSLPSQVSLASSGSLDLFDPLPTSASISTNPTRKTPESFLGPNAALVNLDSLVTKPAQPVPVVNPFLAATGGSAPAPVANPFQMTQPVPPTLNQMRVSPMPSGFGSIAEPMPLASVPAQPVAMVPLAGMAPMGHGMPGTGGGGTPPSMSMPQPLMSMPPQAGSQPTGTTNPFLL